jgi:transposase-like protein
LNKGASIAEICRRIEVIDVTFYRWRKHYRGMQIAEAKGMKELKEESVGFRKLVADLSIDNQILREVARGNF